MSMHYFSCSESPVLLLLLPTGSAIVLPTAACKTAADSTATGHSAIGRTTRQPAS